MVTARLRAVQLQRLVKPKAYHPVQPVATQGVSQHVEAEDKAIGPQAAANQGGVVVVAVQVVLYGVDKNCFLVGLRAESRPLQAVNVDGWYTGI
jgi:hypothetical protein